MTADQTSPTTLTARTPEDILAVVPVVLGFEPTESLVMLTFGSDPPFHARVDLPDAAGRRSPRWPTCSSTPRAGTGCRGCSSSPTATATGSPIGRSRSTAARVASGPASR